MAGDPAIETAGLTKRYGNRIAVDNVTLSVPKGSVFAFLGTNGAGKTTTISVLLNILDRSSGEARVLGLDCARQSLEIKRRVGFVAEAQSMVLINGRFEGAREEGRALVRLPEANPHRHSWSAEDQEGRPTDIAHGQGGVGRTDGGHARLAAHERSHRRPEPRAYLHRHGKLSLPHGKARLASIQSPAEQGHP